MMYLNAQANTSTRKLVNSQTNKKGVSRISRPSLRGRGRGRGWLLLVVTVSRWHNIGTNWILNY